MADKSNPEVDALKRDLETLRGDFGKLLDSVKQSGSAQAKAGADAARDSAESLRGHAVDAAESLEGEIKARPYTSVLAAFATGFILGKLLDR